MILELGTTPVVPQIRKWLRGVDLNHRPLGYEPNELPDCSTPRFHDNNGDEWRQFSAWVFPPRKQFYCLSNEGLTLVEMGRCLRVVKEVHFLRRSAARSL